MINKVEYQISKLQNIFSLIARVGLGASLATHGYSKLMNMESFVGYMIKLSMPLPQLMATMAMLAELLGSILVILGYKTRIASLSIVITMLVATFVHINDPFSKMELPLVYACAFLLLMAFGPGKFSLDK